MSTSGSHPDAVYHPDLLCKALCIESAAQIRVVSMTVVMWWISGGGGTTGHPAQALGLDVVLHRVKVKDGAWICPPHLQVFTQRGGTGQGETGQDSTGQGGAERDRTGRGGAGVEGERSFWGQVKAVTQQGNRF